MIEFVIYYKLYQVMTSLTTFFASGGSGHNSNNPMNM
jgi:hypothetical protein